MRTIKVLRTPEDVIKHKSKGETQESAPAPAPEPTPEAVIPPLPPLPPVKTEETSGEETSGEETSGEETKTEEKSQLSFDEMVEDLKNKHNADELKAMAVDFGLEVKGNKTDIATAILTKQLEMANNPE